MEAVDQATLAWLMDGDPAIRWQTLRDLSNADPSASEAARKSVATEGWGRQIIDGLLPDGTWPHGRWTGSPWVPLLAMDFGMPADEPLFAAACRQFLDPQLSRKDLQSVAGFLKNMDICHIGFWLRIGAYICPADPRLSLLADCLEEFQMADGGWNCRIRPKPETRHSSLHTTFNVLEGLREAASSGIVGAGRYRAMEDRAAEFVLSHQYYKSDKTGKVINEQFTRTTFPSHWHYTVLRGLDFFRSTTWSNDPRSGDAKELLKSQRAPDGRWRLGTPIAGKLPFPIEKTGKESRWVTLKALRILAS